MKINLISIRGRLFLMVDAGALFGLILLSTAVFSLNAFRNDIQKISQNVERSSQALTLVSGAQNAFQAQLGDLKEPDLAEYFAKAVDSGEVHIRQPILLRNNEIGFLQYGLSSRVLLEAARRINTEGGVLICIASQVFGRGEECNKPARIAPLHC